METEGADIETRQLKKGQLASSLTLLALGSSEAIGILDSRASLPIFFAFLTLSAGPSAISDSVIVLFSV